VLVPAGDTGALKTAVIQLARDAERRRQLGALAGQRSSQFSLDRFVERYCSLYSMLTRGAAP
jgi:glycosyltransferase involved in cell wall biosynthesis